MTRDIRNRVSMNVKAFQILKARKGIEGLKLLQKIVLEFKNCEQLEVSKKVNVI